MSFRESLDFLLCQFTLTSVVVRQSVNQEPGVNPQDDFSTNPQTKTIESLNLFLTLFKMRRIE